MEYNEKKAQECFDACKSLLCECILPSWDELPAIELYMDQVVELLNKYLSNLGFFSNDNFEITRPMINNYVKLKMMPAPIKKKYGRMHLCYIIIICILKQTLNISTIQKILPNEIPEDEVKYIYNSFVINQKKAFGYASAQADEFGAKILSNKEGNSQKIDNLILQVASSANVLKCLTENIVNFLNEESE